MKAYKLILSALFSGLLIMGLTACEKEPAEKAGDSLEDAASQAAESVEEAADAIKDKMDQ
jgi:hypothetical protein